jgi:hypothetical protein
VKKIVDLARSTPGRIAAAIAGIGAVTLIIRGLGLHEITDAIAGCGPYFFLVILFEAGVLACSTLALRSLYGMSAASVPTGQFVRAALLGYAVQGLVPAGRGAAEVTRASLLARWVGGGRAGAAAARMQAVVLVVSGIIAVPAGIACAVLTDSPWLPVAVSISGAVALALGLGLFAIARRARVGAWLGRRVKRAAEFGSDLDAALSRESGLPWRAIGWECLGRVVQVAQQAALIACVGGAIGLTTALCSEGIHLVGAAVGDLIPAQLGATEGNFTLAASALGLPRASAVSIALLAHLAQLVWVIVGSLVPLVWRPLPGVYRPEEST